MKTVAQHLADLARHRQSWKFDVNVYREWRRRTDALREVNALITAIGETNAKRK